MEVVNIKKMGRPTSNPKTNRLELRLSDSEARMLNECAQYLGKNKTEVIIEGITMIYEKNMRKA